MNKKSSFRDGLTCRIIFLKKSCNTRESVFQGLLTAKVGIYKAITYLVIYEVILG